MKNRLPNILMDRFDISEEAYSKAMEAHQETGQSIGDILIENDVISEKQLLEAKSIQYGIPFLPYLPMAHINTNLSRNVTIGFLKKNIMVPMEFKDQDGDQGNVPDGLMDLF
ncbi:MAG: hypothetical protein GY864_08455, partial [Desulfobacterales bacterium]|nr:hypothetical protein [Desulfobacterales bacterium]